MKEFQGWRVLGASELILAGDVYVYQLGKHPLNPKNNHPDTGEKVEELNPLIGRQVYMACNRPAWQMYRKVDGNYRRLQPNPNTTKPLPLP